MLDLEEVDQEGGAIEAEIVFIGSLVIVEMLRVYYNTVCPKMGNYTLALSRRQLILRSCSARCTLYWVLTDDHGMER